MFWACNISSPQMDTILDREGLTLQDLLNEDSILQELKSLNKKLIDFLTRPDVLEEMVTLMISEPSEDINERERYRYPNIVCELLTTDVPYFNEKLINESLLSKLYSFLESEPPLNPLLASFFSRTMGILVTRGQEQNWYSYKLTCLQLLEFLKRKGTCIPLLMKHLGTSAIMDLTLKFVTISETEMKQEVLMWLDSEELIQSIVQLLDPSIDGDRHSSASQLLCDIIIKSREAEYCHEVKQEPNPILNTIELPKTVEKLLDVILCGETCETSIVGGIAVLLTLLEPIKLSGSNAEQECRYGDGNNEKGGCGDPSDHSSSTSPLSPVTLSTAEAILPYLPKLHDLLLNPPKKPPVKMTSGAVDPPLGNTRLHVAKLLSALVATHNPDVNSKLSELGTIGVLLDLFFTYSWNNFLHTQVEKCLAFALNSESALTENSHQNVLHNDIFVKCQLIQRVLTAWNDNEVEQEKPGGCRRGYMGHLIKISNHIVNQMEKGTLGDFIKENLPEEDYKSWEAFSNNTLETINKIQQTFLGGMHPASNSQDDNGFGGDNSLSQDSTVQQTYAEYLTQPMAPQFVDNFGFHENEFNDSDDSLRPPVDQLTNLPFNMAEEDEIERQAELFKQVCSGRLNTLSNDDENDEEDEDDDKEWSTFHSLSPTNRMWNGGEEAANYNSSDDEERPGPEGREEGSHMEIDQASDDNTSSLDRSDPTGSTSTDLSSVPTTSNTSDSTLSVALSKESVTNTSTTKPETTSSFLSDSNANPSAVVNSGLNDEDQQLMDNFRFLSSQGMMAATNGEITVEQNSKNSKIEDDKKSADIQEAKQPEDKLQPQPDLEKVVVAVSATATATVSSASDNRGGDGSISTTPMTAMDSSA
ncbi:phosphatase 6 regulatory subunit 1-like protein fmt isoform X2 [Lycorma delicatula]|uniref:phosphatase 6 regulatory subunit 1-like protein fmt isoform X2 n=1 Tax=Lycorma delicatula TaxID=130591 RepID=UPI003F50E3AE